MWTLEQVSTLVEEMRAANPDLSVWAFLNRADPRGGDNDEAAELIRETPGLALLPARLGNRKAFSNAVAQGLAVTELRPRDAKAEAEMKALGLALEEFNGDSEKTRG